MSLSRGRSERSSVRGETSAASCGSCSPLRWWRSPTIPTRAHPLGRFCLPLVVVTLVGIGVAVPDTEPPVATAAVILPVIVGWSFARRSPGPAATIAVVLAMGGAVWVGSAGWGAARAGLGAIGLIALLPLVRGFGRVVPMPGLGVLVALQGITGVVLPRMLDERSVVVAVLLAVAVNVVLVGGSPRGRSRSERLWDSEGPGSVRVTVRSMDRNATPPERVGADELTVRRATADDRTAMIHLCRASLGWNVGDPNEEFFAWKHDENPFGQSPAWLAVAPDGSLAGLRVLMNWRFTVSPRFGERWRWRDQGRAGSRHCNPSRLAGQGDLQPADPRGTRRTGPRWSGRGLQHTERPEPPRLPQDGLDPGGRVPVAVRLRSPLVATRMAGARAAAEKWSQPTTWASTPARLFADDAAVQGLLDRIDTPPVARKPVGAASQHSAASTTCSGGTRLGHSTTGRCRSVTTWPTE